ncbi:OLC1v1002687C1 [Oldenlandia corymbosa var. corymbosa]|uniref:OLC1v1002687C1 n=1 Tax=Oldenlandia corymbosa var. corymbosa TaxID=529605 RepID=A0AAV1D9W7_OLDCO|nr:OLC1v1002687C1 [Oldenlandia corymbosa var. corymbosa]
MWVFYLVSLPLTMALVAITLRYFAGPDVPRYVHLTVGYTWFCSISIIILVPADIWAAFVGHDKGGISFFWSWSYWSTFLLTWAVVPVIQGYEDAGDFTVSERLKTSAHVNLVYYLIVGSIAFCGVILLIVLRKNWTGSILGFAMACSNTFGLVTGAFLLGFALSEIPRGIWRDADWTTRRKVLSHKVAKMAVKLDDAHQDFSNAIVLDEDPSFKPQGGRFGENDMDYDTDNKTMAALRRHLKRTREQYYQYRSEYVKFVTEAIELEDTIKSYEHPSATGWKYVSSFRSERSGKLGSVFDVVELVWRSILRKQLQRFLALVLGSMSAAILLAEATILPKGVDLSLFSLLINAVQKHEVLVQAAAFVPLLYMCICTYYSLFKIGMLTFYSLTPRQTSSVSLLMICSMVARYAPPISYNFLNLIQLNNGAKTIFEKRMGNIDDAVPFFGKGFNKIYPLIMVIYTILIASNFFDRMLNYFGNWKIFRYQNEEADDPDGFDPSGLIILQRERSWIEQGHKVGELVIPLARSFSNTSIDLESGSSHKVSGSYEEKTSSSLKPGARHDSSKKYTAIRGKEINLNRESGLPSPDEEYSQSQDDEPSSGASTWQSVKMGFRNFKNNIDAKKFMPLRQVQGTRHSQVSSSESLDEIFARIKRPILDHRNFDGEGDELY